VRPGGVRRLDLLIAAFGGFVDWSRRSPRGRSVCGARACGSPRGRSVCGGRASRGSPARTLRRRRSSLPAPTLRRWRSSLPARTLRRGAL